MPLHVEVIAAEQVILAEDADMVVAQRPLVRLRYSQRTRRW